MPLFKEKMKEFLKKRINIYFSENSRHEDREEVVLKDVGDDYIMVGREILPMAFDEINYIELCKKPDEEDE